MRANSSRPDVSLSRRWIAVSWRRERGKGGREGREGGEGGREGREGGREEEEGEICMYGEEKRIDIRRGGRGRRRN